MDEYDTYKQRPEPNRVPPHDPYSNNQPKGYHHRNQVVYGEMFGPSSYPGGAGSSNYAQGDPTRNVKQPTKTGNSVHRSPPVHWDPKRYDVK